MKDILKTIRDYLLLQAALTSLTSNRIYAGGRLPKQYTPSDGNALLFKPRGGGVAYHSQLLEPSIQFECYGAGSDAAAEANSIAIAKALYDVLHDTKGSGAGLRAAQQVSMPVLLEDPETGWAYALTYYDIIVANV